MRDHLHRTVQGGHRPGGNGRPHPRRRFPASTASSCACWKPFLLRRGDPLPSSARGSPFRLHGGPVQVRRLRARARQDDAHVTFPSAALLGGLIKPDGFLAAIGWAGLAATITSVIVPRPHAAGQPPEVPHVRVPGRRALADHHPGCSCTAASPPYTMCCSCSTSCPCTSDDAASHAGRGEAPIRTGIGGFFQADAVSSFFSVSAGSAGEIRLPPVGKWAKQSLSGIITIKNILGSVSEVRNQGER